MSPGWPDDPDTVEEAIADPEAFADKTIGQVADHYSSVIGQLSRKPAIIGHSFGGLLAETGGGRGQQLDTAVGEHLQEVDDVEVGDHGVRQVHKGPGEQFSVQEITDFGYLR